MKRLALIILDGWGEAPPWGGNAITQAGLAFWPRLVGAAARSLLAASGGDVGLPGFLPGNSEAGHMNIGAGRIVPQDPTVINNEISEHGFARNPAMQTIMNHLRQNPDARLHLISLLSDGGVHSHIDHLLALLDYLMSLRAQNVLLHAISDGRDTEPISLIYYLERLERNFSAYQGARLATLIGRYYAMDRDRHADRTARALNLYFYGDGEYVESLPVWMDAQYKAGLTDETLPPARLMNADEVSIRPNDAVIVLNFRPDRTRQLVEGLTLGTVAQTKVATVPANVITGTFMLDTYHLPVVPFFARPAIPHTLPSTLAEAGYTQFHIAESEKYAHITYFLNGGIEEPVAGEERVLIKSGNVASYRDAPAMKATEIVATTLEKLQRQTYDLIAMNLANADMVGHTGDFAATVAACQTIDAELARFVPVLLQKNYSVIVTADHGNAEEKIIPTSGKPQTKHTRNPVPFLLIDNSQPSLRPFGRLADVAPTILELMGISQPPEMTGTSLLHQN